MTVKLNYRIDPRLRANGSVSTDVEGLRDELLTVIGDTDVEVSADWGVALDGRYRDVVTLRLSDYTGHADGVFTPEELKDRTEVRSRFRSLWGRLLQIRSGTLLEKLVANGLSFEEEDRD